MSRPPLLEMRGIAHINTSSEFRKRDLSFWRSSSILTDTRRPSNSLKHRNLKRVRFATPRAGGGVVMPTPSPMDLLKQHAWNWISDLARRKPKIDVIQQRFRAAIPAVNGLSTPVQAAARSCLLGGAGQIYLRQKKKGTLIIVCAITGLLLYAIPGLIVIALGVYDAYVIGKRREHG